MASTLDDRQRFDRDREREPTPISRNPHCVAMADLVTRRAAARARIDPSITALSCPACRGPVYVPADSHLERVECADSNCAAKLITNQAIDGVTVAVANEGDD